MDEIDDPSLAAALERACDVATQQEFRFAYTVAAALREVMSGENDPLTVLVAGLEYHLMVGESRSDGRGPFGPMWESDGRCYPAPLDQVESVVPGTGELWARAARLAPVPFVAARFSDLLWEAKLSDRPHEDAQNAVDSYVRASRDGTGGHHLERADGLRRAVEVASQINDPERRAGAVEAAVDLVEESIDNDEWMPGVVFPLLELFIADRPSRRPRNVMELLSRATERYGDDPWNLETAMGLQARLEPGNNSMLRERQVLAFRDFARRSTGLAKYAHLQHAIETAEEHGLRPLADDIRREVESITDDELDFKTISAGVTVPRDKVDEFIRSFVGDDDLEAALFRFGSYVPSGDSDENRRLVDQRMAKHPLQFLFTRMQIGSDNSLVRSTQGTDEQADLALLEHAVLGEERWR